MNKQQLIESMSKDLIITKESADEVISYIFSRIQSVVMNEKEVVNLRGFGTFVLQDRKARLGRNPKTGDIITIAPSKFIKFKPSEFSKIKELI